MADEELGSGKEVWCEVIERLDDLVIYRYRYADSELCDYHIFAPWFSHAIFDVEPSRFEEVVDQLRLLAETRANLKGL